MATSEQTFFWYDLETTGINPRDGRIMQFAGQRTDLDLKVIGEPVNVLIKLTDDVLPDPDAILITGITPQTSIADGVTEVDFLKKFYNEVALPGTIFAGFNNIRFDDEFMRYLNYRNFYDAYQWQWQDNRGRWDLLDVVRMTRALRPDNINWPFAPDGKSANRLELLTSVNHLDHQNAHDALSDVFATIAVANMIKQKQPKLFDWLLSVRGKKRVQELVDVGQPFVYTSGKYASDFEKTTVAIKLLDHPKRSAALVYDLRHDPTEFIGMKPAELADRLAWTRDEDAPERLPIKVLRYNCCPAIAPLGVLDEASKKRLKLDLSVLEANLSKLEANSSFASNVRQAFEITDGQRQTEALGGQQEVDGQLYDGFFDDHDNKQLLEVRQSNPSALADLTANFNDSRLQQLLPLYKARNFMKSLTPEEREAWEKYRMHRLTDGGENSRLSKFMARLQELKSRQEVSEKQYLLEELQLYAESIMPIDID